MASAPLSDAEYDALAGVFDRCSPFDIDGVLGVLHAIAVAPSLVGPSQWLPLILPNGLAGATTAGGEHTLMLVLRLYSEVLDGIAARAPMIPPDDDVEGCESFAAGYVQGAALDPAWIGNADRWTFAAYVAFLGNQLDLVPDAVAAKLTDKDTDKVVMRRELPAIVMAAHDTFKKLGAVDAGEARATARRRVGRNEPCPCGSGRKFKRCCIDMRPVTDA